MIDLSLVLMDDIWEELKKRYDGIILTIIKSRDNSHEESQVSFSGGKFTCIGLAEHTKDKILEDLRNSTEGVK